MEVSGRDRLGRYEPHRVNLVAVCCGKVRSRPLEMGTGGIELATQPSGYTKRDLDDRVEPLPPSCRPARSNSST